MKKSLAFLFLLLISGCSSDYNQSETKLKIKFPQQKLKEWNVVYDSASGYNKSYGTMVDNEIAFTPYKDVNSVSNRPSPEFLFSDLRGKNLSTNVYRLLSVQGFKLSNEAEGVILISRPTFLDEGRYILRTYITLYGKDKTEIAVLEVFNNIRKETTSRGIRYKDTGDLLNDSRYAELCAEKISDVLKQITEK